MFEKVVTQIAGDEIQNIDEFCMFVFQNSSMRDLSTSYQLLYKVGLQLVNKQGRLIKRFKKEFNDQGFTVTGSYISKENEFFSRAGEIATRYNNVTGDVTVIFRDSLWRCGEYGDGGSCFFGFNSHHPDRIFNLGGFGICIEETPSRCWAIPYKEGLVLFNGYGPVRIRSIAHLVMKIRGYDHIDSKVYLNFEPSGDDWIYTNGDSIYIGNEPLSGSYITFDDCFHEPDYYAYCDRCGDGIQEDDDYILIGDEFYCDDSCARRAGYEYCDVCGEWTGSVVHCYDNGQDYCDSCASDNLYDCHSCGEYHTSENIYECGDSYYCEDCAQDNGYKCKDCGEFTECIKITDDNGDDEYYCKDCAPNHVTICIECLKIDTSFPDNYNAHHTCIDCHSVTIQIQEGMYQPSII